MAYCKKCDICGATFDYNCLKIDHVRFGEMDIGYVKSPAILAEKHMTVAPIVLARSKM